MVKGSRVQPLVRVGVVVSLDGYGKWVRGSGR